VSESIVASSVVEQNGATLVEFALVITVLVTLLLAITDFGRMLFTWNAAAEATRWGARTAVVCDKPAGSTVPTPVLNNMKAILPQLTAANVTINWYNPEGTINNSCDASNCKGVEVSVTGLTVTPISPFMGFVMPAVPALKTYLPRESMQSKSASNDNNPVCM